MADDDPIMEPTCECGASTPTHDATEHHPFCSREIKGREKESDGA